MNLHVLEMLLLDAVSACKEARITRELGVIRRMLIHTADAARGEQGIPRMDAEGFTALKIGGGGVEGLAHTGDGAQLLDRGRRGCSGDGKRQHTRAGGRAIRVRPASLVRIEQQVDHGDMLENPHVGQAFDRREQRLGDLLARHVGMKRDTRPGVRALTREGQRAVLLALELRAQRNQVVDDRARGTDHDVHALAAVLAVPGVKRVLKERVVILGLGQHADAALGEHRIALVEGALRQHHDLGTRRRSERGIQARHAASDNRDIARHVHMVRRHPRPLSFRRPTQGTHPSGRRSCGTLPDAS